jgi:hypothetical protein
MSGLDARGTLAAIRGPGALPFPLCAGLPVTRAGTSCLRKDVPAHAHGQNFAESRPPDEVRGSFRDGVDGRVGVG